MSRDSNLSGSAARTQKKENGRKPRWLKEQPNRLQAILAGPRE